MKAIVDDRITIEGSLFVAACACGYIGQYSTKAACLSMLARGSCRQCKKDYRAIDDTALDVYKRTDGRWCSSCPGCGNEQAYTRKDHAKQSSVAGWKCKKCVSKEKGFDSNKPVGAKQSLFNKFKKSAQSRGLDWGLSLEDMWESYTGYCSFSGCKLEIDCGKTTASLDRIDSSLGYIKDNIQWVTTDLNMAKRNMDNQKFIDMCCSVAAYQASIK